jgi:B9 domain-containing protein 1
MPFESSFRSLNPSGWPQLVITCVYPDFLGREVAKGYGVVHIPTTPGRHERTVQIFSPLTSSVMLKFFGFLVGQRAELINAPKVVASGDGREITRTKTEGSVKVVFQVTLRDLEKFGYNV